MQNGSIARRLAVFLADIPLNDTGLEVEQLATLAGLVGSGLGLSLVPSTAIGYFDPERVAIVPVQDTALRRQIYVVRVASAGWTPAAAGFLALLRTANARELRQHSLLMTGQQ